MFYLNGVLKTKYTPKCLLNQNIDVYYKRLLDVNKIGYIFEVKIKTETFDLYVINKNINIYKKNLFIVSIVSNWGFESNKYSLYIKFVDFISQNTIYSFSKNS